MKEKRTNKIILGIDNYEEVIKKDSSKNADIKITKYDDNIYYGYSITGDKRVDYTIILNNEVPEYFRGILYSEVIVKNKQDWDNAIMSSAIRYRMNCYAKIKEIG